jgi:hypothetical protein
VGFTDSTAEEESEGEYIIYSNDEYAICLNNAYKKSVMTAFPTFSDKEIKALCYYLNTESERLNLAYPKDELYVHSQKCKTYKALISKLYAQKSKLKSKRTDKIVDNGPFVKQVNRSIQFLQLPDNASNMSMQERKSLIHIEYQQAEYYQVEINTFGWYNIDMLSKNIPGVVDSKVTNFRSILYCPMPRYTVPVVY